MDKNTKNLINKVSEAMGMPPDMALRGPSPFVGCDIGTPSRETKIDRLEDWYSDLLYGMDDELLDQEYEYRIGKV